MACNVCEGHQTVLAEWVACMHLQFSFFKSDDRIQLEADSSCFILDQGWVMVSLRSFCRLAELVKWQPLASFGYLICFRKRRESYSSKTNRGLVCFQEREIRCKLPQGLTGDNTKSWLNSGTDKLQAFAFLRTFDVLSHRVFVVLRLSEIRSKPFPTCCLRLMAALVQVELDSCWLQHTSI